MFGAWTSQRLVGVGGLNTDPYTQEPRVGRVRHLYVLEARRRRGVGRSLVAAIAAEAQGSFDRLRVRTPSPGGAAFYESFGFERCSEKHCTHSLDLRSMELRAVRKAAHNHVRAVVDGRIDDAVASVVAEGREEIRENLSRLPRPIEGRVEDVREDRGEFVVLLWFKTSPEDEYGVVVESHWAYVDDEPLLHWGYPL